ncbi:hypothetical protein BH20VER2_BH20VER2_15500 [soil metagenome]|nr:hypothetical protein [Chthoniobacterales bacterium]
MPSVLLKDVPKKLHQQLRARAQRNRRSMHQEMLFLLERAVTGAADTAEELPPPMPTPRPLTDAWLKAAVRRGRA